ncbi:MAG: TonB-dependent receptor [Longimicrobiales bacterium]
MRYLCAVALVVGWMAWPATARAQSPGKGAEPVGTIRGRVVDGERLLPVAGAEVTAESPHLPSHRPVLTGTDGWFTLTSVGVGTYTLSAVNLGYSGARLADVVVKPGRTTFVEIAIQVAPIEVEGFVVTSSFFAKQVAEAAAPVSYSGEEIRRAPGSAGDVSRIFMTLPSVAKVSDQSNGLAVRGGSPTENAFFVDHIEIPNINHFPSQGSSLGPISLLNTDLIGNAAFYTGGFSSQFGDRLSSVMDIELREGNREEFDAQLDLNFAGVGAVAEGPLGGGKGSYVASFRRSFLDLLVDAIGTATDVAPRYSDGTLKLAWDLNPRHRLVALGVVGLDDISSPRVAAVENDLNVFGGQKSREGALGVDWQALWSDRVVSNTTLSFMGTGFQEDLWETSSDLNLIEKDSREGALTLRSSNRVHLGPSAALRFGVEAKAILADYDQSFAEYTGSLGQHVPALVMNDELRTGRGALFASLEAKPLPRLTATLGARSDYFDYTGDWSVSPRAALSLRATSRTTLNLSGGIFRQSLPLVLLAQQEENRELAEPWAVHAVGGVEHLISGDTRLTVEGYWKDYRDSPVDPAEPGLFVVDELIYRYGFFFNHDVLESRGKARSRGVEVLLQKKLVEGFYGLAAASWSKSEYDAGDGIWRDRVYDNRWTASVEGGYRPNNRWEFSLRWLYAGGPPYTPLDLEASAAEGRDVLDATRINGARYPDYHSLNLRFDRRFNFQGSNLVWYVSVWNAYNRKNIAAYSWNGVKGKVDTMHQWGMLPIFGLEWEF